MCVCMYVCESMCACFGVVDAQWITKFQFTLTVIELIFLCKQLLINYNEKVW